MAAAAWDAVAPKSSGTRKGLADYLRDYGITVRVDPKWGKRSTFGRW
jgi:hypothetical protein